MGSSIGVGVCWSGGSPEGQAREGDADDEGGRRGARNPGPGGLIDKAQQQDGDGEPGIDEQDSDACADDGQVQVRYAQLVA
ncbi:MULTISPECIES: hypothetical protein [Streptomyces]|uniref:hypothetical protein n=1 Tax=Streptomyces lycopersici TaxID=2974589 RepID=UPI0021CF8602|nr:hypothetical protein [Streptomyces sp. NEAU-383]